MASLMKAGAILAPWLQQSGLSHRLLEQRLQLDWAAIAGHLIAQHSRPFRLRHRKLTITVESPAWLHQLRYLEPTLLEQIHRAIGPKLVSELRWVVGAVSTPELSDQLGVPSASAPPPLSAEAQATIDAALAPLGDPAIAEIARRVMQKALARHH
jgi:hypothetical protein